MRENSQSETLSLNGEWQFSLGDQSGPINVPGVWETQGFRDDLEGLAIYRRSFDVPDNWQDARIFLRFGAVSYYIEAFVNGQPVGTHEGLWTAFEFDVTDALHFGQPNDIELRVIKPGIDGDRFPYRDVLVGFIPYVSITFGGIWQSVELVAIRDLTWQNFHIAADWATGQVHLEANVAPLKSRHLRAITEIIDQHGNVVTKAESVLTNDGAFSLTLSIENRAEWKPDSPTMYSVSLTLYDEDHNRLITGLSRYFGFRKLSADGDQLLFNGQPVNLRGILSWGWDPATLAPIPTDDEVRHEFKRIRALGFNMVKLCLFVPTRNVFDIADVEGMFLWLELPMWYQRMNDHLREQSVIEYTDILAAVHHHPSIIIYSLGCELGAEMADASLLETLNNLARGAVTDALVCDNSGSGEAYKGLSFDYADFNDYHFYCDLHYFVSLVDHFRRDWREPRPWIFGEFCDCDDFRDVDEINAANGGQRPAWREMMGAGATLERWAGIEQEQRMAALNLPFSSQQLVDISHRQSFVMRKTVLEYVRSRSGMGGYVITGLRDTPISTSGVFDDLGRAKYDADAFRAFNADSVLILEQGRSRVWQNGGDRPSPADRFNHISGGDVRFRVVLSHIGAPLTDQTLHWQLRMPDGSIHVEGEQRLSKPILPGNPSEIGVIEFAMLDTTTPMQCTLLVELGAVTSNAWPLWVYPQLATWTQPVSIYNPSGNLSWLEGFVPMNWLLNPTRLEGLSPILITSVIDAVVIDYAKHGGRVMALQSGKDSIATSPVPFWRESIKLLYDHSILNNFPHDGYADLQFYHLATDHALDTAAIRSKWTEITDVKPIIRRLDARLFTTLDYLIGLQVGNGKIIASTLRFRGGAGDQVNGLQNNVAGAYLLRQMLDYLQ
ncbi:MAG: hypothetical protein H7175_08970 [Burkholderiales bacterium]|nr:hypothetical protein [Anaerolineae bacterium]